MSDTDGEECCERKDVDGLDIIDVMMNQNPSWKSTHYYFDRIQAPENVDVPHCFFASWISEPQILAKAPN